MDKYNRLPLVSAFRQAFPKPTFRLSPEQAEKLKTYTNVLLGMLAGAGMLTMMVLAPNALQALDLFQRRRGRRKLAPLEREQRVIRSFYYLRARGHIEVHQKGNDYEVSLTKQGRRQIRKMNFQTLAVPKNVRWDGKFWQVAADIPTKQHRRGADALRQKLKEMGFYPLQRTLWFYPYDPRMELEFISRTYGISQFVTTMKIAELDESDERVLKGHFKKQAII